MLEFEPFSVPALQKALPYIKINKSLCSDISAGYLFMWRFDADIRFCFRNGTFLVRQMIGEQPAFSYPIGDDPNGMIDELKEYVRLSGLPLRFFAVDDDILLKIRADSRLQPAMWAYESRWSDYIYSFEDILTLAGKRFSGQRNHINKFKRLYGEPDIRFLTASDRSSVKAFLEEYAAYHRDGNQFELKELDITEELFDVCEALSLYPAGLFIQGKLAAISIGEVMNDMLMIHAEKALVKYQGIYPTMFSGFVNLISKYSDHKLEYVNREDDSGDPGLRMSKLQYHPITMANKYLVHVSSPAIRSKSKVTVIGHDVILTEFRESDKKAYLALNTDVDNNKYWGYDYREDIYLTEPIDENTFFDSVVYDMQAGDSINFAVRLSEDGEMIGETILWNFTSDDTAELGCRIFPGYQGRGYGKEAFGLATEYAENVLKLRVRAKCYRENMPSYHMITSNGFVKIDEDSRFYYFEKRKI